MIDARGAGDLSSLSCGWQKFVGQELKLARPHGVERPVVMDATVKQLDGYRFVYTLPFAEDRIFVEDTYYSTSAELNRRAIVQRIERYAEARDWVGAEVVREEAGVLPVAMGGDFDGYWRSGGAKTPKAGMRAGLFHPTTGLFAARCDPHGRDAGRSARLCGAPTCMMRPIAWRAMPGDARGFSVCSTRCCSRPRSRMSDTAFWSVSIVFRPTLVGVSMRGNRPCRQGTNSDRTAAGADPARHRRFARSGMRARSSSDRVSAGWRWPSACNRRACRRRSSRRATSRAARLLLGA